MVKRVLFAVLVAISSIAWAGPKPPDVATYVPVTPTYASGTTANVPLNANTTTPYRGLTDIPSLDSGWVTTGPAESESGSNYTLCYMDGGPADECKYRTSCNITTIAKDDPIRNWGLPGTSHGHMYYGARKVNAWTTYKSLRSQKSSNCGGGPFNNSGYWFPWVQKTMSGATWVVKPPRIDVYYQNSNLDPTQAHGMAHAPRGLRFVFGAEMDDGWAWMNAIIATANAQPGTSGRYSFSAPGATVPNSHLRITCAGLSIDALGFKNADGTDPFGGACTSDKTMTMRLGSSPCWDGVNLWSTDGYHHVIPKIWDNVASKYVCPTNYYEIFQLQLLIHFRHNGFSDYGTWSCSSDAAYVAATGSTIPTCGSFHADWMDGWDGSTRFTAETFCMGAENGRAHECANSRISSTDALVQGFAAPDSSRNPQVTCPDETAPACDYKPTTTANMWKAPTSIAGPHGPHVIHN